MTFLPIVSRDLSLTARRAGTYWLRFWAAVLAVAIWLVLLSEAKRLTPAGAGRLLWNSGGIIAMGFSLLAGVFLTADCLSEEKRDGTLGLLFLTDLRGHDIVLGKLAARALRAYFVLFAAFPVLSATVLLGGASGGEVERLILVFMVTLFFSLGAGMFASAISHESRQATARALGVVALFAAMGPAIWWALGFISPRLAPSVLLWPSPGFAYVSAFDTAYKRPSGASGFWLSVVLVFGIGLAGIIIASRRLSHEAQLAVEGPPTPRFARPWRFGRGLARVKRAALLRWNPVFWLAVRDPGPRRLATFALLALVPLWFIFSEVVFLARPSAKLLVPNAQVMFSLLSAYGIHFVTKAFVATEASRRWSLDGQSGALELLLVTPVTIPSVIRGQEQALWRQLRWPLGILCMVNAGLFLAVAGNSNNPSLGGTEVMLLEMLAGGMFMLVADFHALVWVGMWQGLNRRGHLRAAAVTMLNVVGVGWLGLLPMLMLLSNARPGGTGGVLALWFFFGAFVDVLLAASAKRKLQDEFRRAASERFQP